MTWQIGLTVWVVIGFLTCLWAIYDDLNLGLDFDLMDLVMVFVVSWFGLLFTIWCINQQWKKNGIPVLVKGRK